MKRLVCGVLTFFALVLDCTLLVRVTSFGIRPSLMLCVVLSFGFTDAPFTGAMAGLFGGLLMDVMFGPTLGFYGVIYLLVGYAASVGYLRGFGENVLFSIVCVAGGYLAKELLSFLFALMMGVKTENILLLLLRYILPSGILTGLLGLPIYGMTRWLFGRGFMQVSKYRDYDF